jgi:hypothetical protein
MTIDRRALVSRHNIRISAPDPLTPLSVGNSEFAFTADVTGLQSFPEFHQSGMPLCTQAQWGWHTMPNPKGYALEQTLTAYETGRGMATYPDDHDLTGGPSDAGAWLRANPHRLSLAQIGFVRPNGTAAVENLAMTDISSVEQTLDLWAGQLASAFELRGRHVRVETVCHPDQDILAVRVRSGLLASQEIADWRVAEDWRSPSKHSTILNASAHRHDFERRLDADGYFAALAASPHKHVARLSEHEFVITSATNELSFVVAFSARSDIGEMPAFDQVRSAASAHWERFWSTGGAVDLGGSTDPRANELERRIVLSQFLTAIHCAGSMPPQETGLVTNSWYGKFHLEMHWWHAAHFGPWGRLELLERSLPWYKAILPIARDTAERQCCRGARWPKMAGPDGRESPSPVGNFLIWQQPHLIYFAEMAFRARPTSETLDQYASLVFETAEFMASYPVWEGSRYVLGPPLIPAQECYGRSRATLVNPTFELAYWWWGLETAQRWRERTGLPRNAAWENVKLHLSMPTVRHGLYAAIESPPYLTRTDHPSLVAAYGVVPPTPMIDPQIMRRTLNDVVKNWDWSSTWGWDYPMLAMTAARLGDRDLAIEMLLIDTPKNRYLANGHNFQRPSSLPLYLPGNGGLLMAVAMMAGRWDGCTISLGNAPGFPLSGKWSVASEGLVPVI